ncbi:MAG: hypothetical protein NTW21_33065 [Verrucomicrobia bacterium]|nr:hypothetical protein [Verrucomicrobiota bacterium]
MRLLGNAFPLTLVRRPVRIEPHPLDELRQAIAARGCVSFWGHANAPPTSPDLRALAASRQIAQIPALPPLPVLAAISPDFPLALPNGICSFVSVRHSPPP